MELSCLSSTAALIGAVSPRSPVPNDSEDTRSSYYLEDAATEFQVQGLELDWVCVT